MATSVPGRLTEGLAFAALLRQHRLTAGLTQAELAEQAGLSERGIADLERGARRYTRLDTIHLLADGLHLTPPERAALVAPGRRSGQQHLASLELFRSYKLIELVWLAEEIVGHQLYGFVSKAGPRPRYDKLYPMDMPFVETLDEAKHFLRGPATNAQPSSPRKAPISSWMRPAGTGSAPDAGAHGANGVTVEHMATGAPRASG